MKNLRTRFISVSAIGWLAASLISLGLVAGAFFHAQNLDMTEVLGFISGALDVWLILKQNIWNWPVGIANNIFFVVLFWNAHLYADMGLQLIYIVMSIFGWYWWLHGGKNKSELRVSRIGRLESMTLTLLTLGGTAVMAGYLSRAHDAAPLLDGLTTAMSLAAQYMLTKKYLENWLVWIAVDVIYIYLYAVKHLPLTAVLYVIFLCLSTRGLLEWRKPHTAKKAAPKLVLQEGQP